MIAHVIKILLIFILAPLVGCLLTGIDRKITARLQHRVGPPLLQPLYDVFKLFSKENIAVSKYQNVTVLIYFTFIAASVVMLFFQTDLLMLIFVFTIANIALIVGGMGTGSPYSKVGSQREIIALLSYEPLLIFFIIGIYMITGSFRIHSIDLAGGPLLFKLPLIFITMLFVVGIKCKKSPFDISTSHHAHQELIKGITTEFSGPALGVIEITHWYETVLCLGFIFLFWKTNIIMGLVLAIFVFLFEIVLDNITARLTWQWMLKTTWTIIIALSIINIIAIYLLNSKIV